MSKPKIFLVSSFFLALVLLAITSPTTFIGFCFFVVAGIMALGSSAPKKVGPVLPEVEVEVTPKKEVLKAYSDGMVRRMQNLKQYRRPE